MPFQDQSSPSLNTRRGSSTGVVALVCIVGLTLIVGAIVAVVMQRGKRELQNSGAFSLAMTEAGQAPCVTARLGSPLVASGSVVGSVRSSGGQSYADIELGVRGPLATGKIHIVATGTSDSWKAQYLSVRTGDDRLLLLPAVAPCQ